jgi:RluA family pseudouridine synthase
LLNFGAIYVNGKRQRQETFLNKEDLVRVHFRPKRYETPADLPIIFEDENFLAIDKPSGLPTHPTLDNYVENASSFLTSRLTKKVYVTHRLDIGTAGVLIFAKSAAAQADLNRLLSERRVKKIYRALTEHCPPVGRYEHHLEVDGPSPKKVFERPSPASSHAVLKINEVWKVQDGFASEIELETGRTHQIRAQLSFLGFPILGDSLYGFKGNNKKYVPERLALECFHISFTYRTRTIGIYRPTSLAPLT